MSDTQKTAVIFGLANKRSIAWAIAQKLHGAGWRLAISYQNERMEQEAKDLITDLPGAEGFMCDVSSDDQIAKVFEEFKSLYGVLHGIVHSVAFAPAEELSANGFEVEPMGPKSVAIQAVPAGVAANDAEHLLTEIIDGIERENAAISIDTLQAKIAASTACHAAIKVNMPLDQTKMEWLLGALAKTDCPMSCPHGRPVVLRYSVREIERAFHRI